MSCIWSKFWITDVAIRNVNYSKSKAWSSKDGIKLTADIWVTSSASNEVLGITLSTTAITLKRCNEMVLLWKVRYVGIIFLSQLSPINWYFNSPPSLQFFLISSISESRNASHDESFLEMDFEVVHNPSLTNLSISCKYKQNVI